MESKRTCFSFFITMYKIIIGVMKLKIVIINGQNHKGSTYHIASMLANKIGGDIKEYFLPKDFSSFCLGCTQCFMKDEALCPHHEAISPIVKSMDEADLIILAVGQVPVVAGLGLDLVKGEVDEGKPYATKDPKVWVCGDIAKSRFDKTVVGGVRTGKEVALYIDMALGGK